jgi:hypothetical protein
MTVKFTTHLKLAGDWGEEGGESEKIQFKKEQKLHDENPHCLGPAVPFPSLLCDCGGAHTLGKSCLPNRLSAECSASHSARPAVCCAYLHSSALGSPITELAGLSFRGER